MNTDALLHKCRWTLREGRPSGAWSMGERLAVAVVLIDRSTLDELDYTYGQATDYLYAEMGMPAGAFSAWLEHVRRTVLDDKPSPRAQ